MIISSLLTFIFIRQRKIVESGSRDAVFVFGVETRDVGLQGVEHLALRVPLASKLHKMYIWGVVEPTSTISITALRRQLHAVLGQVHHAATRFQIAFHSQPVAELIPIVPHEGERETASAPANVQYISASEFRDQIHLVLRAVEHQHATYVITNRGTPVAQLVPPHAQRLVEQGVGMNPITALVSLKGGVGKTTSAMHLAAVAASQSQQVTVLDGDGEHSAVHWAELATKLDPLPFSVRSCEERTLIEQARALRDAGQTVFIDTPPNDRTLLLKAAGIADHIVVPVAPTGIDLDRLRGTLQLLADTSAITGRELDVAIILVRFTARKALAREAEELLQDFPILNTRIRALKTYEEAFGSVPEYLDEYAQVWKELRA